jgi:eukaryotic-like serine/threonine-protein kinase
MKVCPRCSEPYADDAGFCPLDGTALTRDPDPFVGRTLAARYRLLRRLGSGGMAVVYLARHVMIERLSAIKILRQDLGMNVTHRERFLREARAVNRINHPNIVEITDFGEDGGLVYLVMEYVEGDSLQTAVASGRLEMARAIRIALQIASALGRAHEMGVIHRDLKPENVLLVPRGGVDFAKLTDFGIAKIVDAPALTFTAQRFGTPGYISPEYISGEDATALGDIYALGVVTYQMVTGELPFNARVPVELLAMALQGTPVTPSERIGAIPADLEQLILRMIARDPAERPRDAYVVHEALEAMLQRLTGEVPRLLAPAASGDGPVSEDVPELTAMLVDDGPVSVGPSPRSWLASELAARSPGEIAESWQKTLADLGKHIDAAGRARGPTEGVRRARDLSDHARMLIASLEKAKGAVREHQAEVDALQARGRSFRATLGHAIDALSRDRSRALAHLEAVGALRAGIQEEIAITPRGDARQREALAWEFAALQAEENRARVTVRDLDYQLDALQRQLAEQNGHLEVELAGGTGMLEGALSAVRRITGELVRTMADAASCL